MRQRILALAPVTAVAVLAFVALLLGACGKTETKAPPAASNPASSTPPAPVAVEITENDRGFTPLVVTVERGQLVQVTFLNQGSTAHNLRIAGPTGQFSATGDTVAGSPLVQAGDRATVEWKAPAQRGDFKFRCDLHPDHTGVIAVR